MTVTTKNIIDSYLKDINETNPIMINKYHEAMISITNKLREKILEGEVYKPHNNMGLFGIIRVKTKKKPIDWNMTKNTGKIHYFDNNHSNGFVYPFIWGKLLNVHMKIGFKYMNVYKFKTIDSFSDKIRDKIFKVGIFDVPNYL